MARVFFSYNHKDEALRNQLETHLALLKHQGLIEAWHDRRILAGADIDRSISAEMEASNIILLLVSADFLASDYCYCREMARAMERHEAGQARVIPVILRHCDWHSAPFGKLLALPRDGKPIVSWPDHDEAFADVARQIRLTVEEMNRASPPLHTPKEVPAEPAAQTSPRHAPLPRSSNLRLKQEFSDQDRDEFLRQTFDYIANFFEGSLRAMEERHPGVKGKLERIDTRHFSAVLYKHGRVAAQCAIALGGSMGPRSQNITFSYDQIGGGINEVLHVHASSQALYIKALGMQGFSNDEGQRHLSPEGAAEHLWALMIRRLQE